MCYSKIEQLGSEFKQTLFICATNVNDYLSAVLIYGSVTVEPIDELH